MRFSVRHDTRYRYSAPVTLSTHLIRMTPRHDAGALVSSRLVIEPEPRLVREIADRWGNRIFEVTFNGPTDILTIASHFEVDTRAQPALPRDADVPLLPWPASPSNGAAAFVVSNAPEAAVQAFAGELAEASAWQAPAFLERLNHTLYERIDRQIRTYGDANSATQTLQSKTGACRDLAVLFMEACRSLGIASRFVSGYQARHESKDGQRHLHAWPEAYIPGTGWLAFDPTHGTQVSDAHVALCAAPRQSATMPVEGGFYGNGVSSSLAYEVEITTD